MLETLIDPLAIETWSGNRLAEKIRKHPKTMYHYVSTRFRLIPRSIGFEGLEPQWTAWVSFGGYFWGRGKRLKWKAPADLPYCGYSPSNKPHSVPIQVSLKVSWSLSQGNFQTNPHLMLNMLYISFYPQIIPSQSTYRWFFQDMTYPMKSLRGRSKFWWSPHIWTRQLGWFFIPN